MSFTPRTKKMLRVLLLEEKIQSVQKLADRIGISRRTALREMKDVNFGLRGYDVHFRSRTGVGIWLEGGRIQKNKLLIEISRGDSYDVADREERRKRLIREILRERGPKKLFCYASTMRVSETTVSNDLASLEAWLNGQGLFVNRIPGSGVEIVGSEEDYRRARGAQMFDIKDKEMLYRENVRTGCGADTQEHVIRAVGQMLVDSGYVDQSYVEAMLAREKSFSTYMGSDLALPHGIESSKKDIKASGIAVMVFPDGTPWGDEMVNIVIGIAGVGDEHLRILSVIADRMLDPEAVEDIVNGDEDTVYKMFSET